MWQLWQLKEAPLNCAQYTSIIQLIDICFVFILLCKLGILLRYTPWRKSVSDWCLINAGSVLRNLLQRYRSTSAGQRIRGVHSQAASLRSNTSRSYPERVIQNFRGQPTLHSNTPAANTTTGAGIYGCFPHPAL
jgi:hypothetical protein